MGFSGGAEKGKSMIRQLQAARAHPAFGQLVRYGIAGAASSLVYSAVYMPLTATVFPGPRAVLAVPFAFLVAVSFGFVVHSRWSFKDQGGARGPAQQAKFVLVQAFGLLLNAAITWSGTKLLGLHPWVPLVPAILLAAILSFVLNRYWVFD